MKNTDIKNLTSAPYAPLAEYARKVGAEGCVLLKNEGEVLPIKETDTVSLFGRTQIDYNKSGTGSGGLVRVKYTVNILEGIKENGKIRLNEDLVEVYRNWLIENPFDNGGGWAQEPWCQKEMVPDEKTVANARKKSDVAVIVIGRTAGEDKDNSADKGSWYLSDEEEAMLKIVSSYFEKTVVLLNTGNIIDMKWVEKYNIKSVMYIWQGGQEGGRSVADVLSGDVTPCGKLSDTIARDISLYPSVKNFGNKDFNIYAEDIYVGYRYFETFAKEDVLYPFGFGLSYTEFSCKITEVNENGDKIVVGVEVENKGNYKGREVIQFYVEAPQGKLGKSLRSLCAFNKTKLLSPGEKQIIYAEIKISDMASYDDSGVMGNKSCYVLEAGEYNIYAGNSVRNCEIAYTYKVKSTTVVQKCREVLAPEKSFDIMHPQEKDGKYTVSFKPVSKRTANYDSYVKSALPSEIRQTGDKGIKLSDVRDGRNSLEEFVAQLSDVDLMCLVKGEGMGSPKVRSGSAGAVGGTTQSLCDFGIPIASLHDGPSGIRMDSGECATSLPNGTAIACTWDVEAAEKLYELLSIEMCGYEVDCILGPGVNIHRVPLNGRNFEYFSEDPYLTGMIAGGLVRGVAKHGNSATVKHFAANSQEFMRRDVDSVMSERAAREIYLKAFEYIVRNAPITSLMTSYNPINGKWTANNYELNTMILREEWGYNGYVVTDWWPKLSKKETAYTDLRNLVEAQNDVFMPVPDALTFNDNLSESLKSGRITRGQLQRNAMNILKFLLQTNSLDRFIENGCVIKRSLYELRDSLETDVVIENIENDKDCTLELNEIGDHLLCVEYTSDEPDITQMTVTVRTDGRFVSSITINGTTGEVKTAYKDVPFDSRNVSFALVYPEKLLKITKVEIKK